MWMVMMGNDFNDGLSERGFMGVLWDSWDLVLVVWGVALFGLPLPFVRPGHPHPGPLPLLMGVLGERG